MNSNNFKTNLKIFQISPEVRFTASTSYQVQEVKRLVNQKDKEQNVKSTI